MGNPWKSVREMVSGNAESYVLPCDAQILEKANEERELECKFHPELLPEPFYGTPDAPVYVLLANPGFSKEDEAWHNRKDFQQALLDVLEHKPREYPFHVLDPKFKDSPGGEWWLKHARDLIESAGLEKVAKGLFVVELLAYHSSKLRLLPKKLSSNGVFPSFDYSMDLVKNAIKNDKYIVLMRSKKEWFKLIPELKSYSKLCCTNSPQAAYLSKGNMEKFEEVCSTINENVAN